MYGDFFLQNRQLPEKLYAGRVRLVEEFPDTTSQVGFEVSCTQAHITTSIATRGGYGPYNYNYGGLIGVTDDGVEGVDVDVATGSFTQTKTFHPAFVSPAYVRFLTAMCGRVNQYPWRGYDTGECRFIGASGGFRHDAKSCDITFKFATSQNAYGLQIGDIYVPFKYGWDYLWVRYATRNMNGTCVKWPMAVYVEKVYYGMNMMSLGIG